MTYFHWLLKDFHITIFANEITCYILDGEMFKNTSAKMPIYGNKIS